MLHEAGDLDLDANVSTYVPEIATTPYHGATMRNLLDMRASIALEPEQQRAHEIAANWEPAAGGEQDAEHRPESPGGDDSRRRGSATGNGGRR